MNEEAAPPPPVEAPAATVAATGAEAAATLLPSPSDDHDSPDSHNNNDSSSSSNRPHNEKEDTPDDVNDAPPVAVATSGDDDDSMDDPAVTEISPSNNSTTTTTTTTTGLKILFLSSDTGGGHRASAESLAKQFQILFPGSTYDLLDVVGEDFGPPFNSLVSLYKHLSAHPSQWKLLYNVSNSRGFEMLADAHFKLMFERAIRRRIRTYNPDVVVSVHPMMTNVPVLSCEKISNETGRHLPMFTVVTDLGSAHCLWFANGVEKMFVGSEQVKALAQERGKVPDAKLRLVGLPIRHDFAVQAEQLGDRMSPAGQAYQKRVRGDLQLPHTDRPTILCMGGGEGVGSLERIVEALYVELVAQGIDALILVVCGRNEKLQKSLATKNWEDVFATWSNAKARYGIGKHTMMDVCGTGMSASAAGCIQGSTVGSIRRILSTGTLSMGNMISLPTEEERLEEQQKENAPEDNKDEKATTLAEAIVEASSIALADSMEGKMPGQVTVQGLGFVTNMAEYMVAADVLVTKAGPGTISEAAALSLPVMLTSFLPGQEEGNVDFVIEGNFGAYVNVSDPIGIAEEVCMWLADDERRARLSRAAKAKGAPYAARDIAQEIGDSAVKWKELNHQKDVAAAASAATATT